MSVKYPFAIQFKKKKGSHRLWPVDPFPRDLGSKQCTGFFTGISVEVCSTHDILDLYKNGFYGKGSKSRDAPQIVVSKAECKSATDRHINTGETLILSLEEAFFLSYFINVLKIVDVDGEEIMWRQLLEKVEQIDANFLYRLAGYLFLKAKGWIVKSGLKYGGDFIVYKNGPKFYHASFVVMIYVCDKHTPPTIIEMKGLQRIAETCNKDVLILSISRPHNFQINDLQDISHLSISESIIKRFNLTEYTSNEAAK